MTTIVMMDKDKVASFDVDPQKGFTPLCPNELPVPGGAGIVSELNQQATFGRLRVASRDAHTPSSVWIANKDHPQLEVISGHKNVDLRWNAHCIVGTLGFEFLEGLPNRKYDFQVFKGIEPDMHPYGACYHDLGDTQSTGVIEYLRQNGIEQVIVGGLATEFCVKKTVLQLLSAGFQVVVNMAACRGFDEKAAWLEMAQAGALLAESASDLSNSLPLQATPRPVKR